MAAPYLTISRIRSILFEKKFDEKGHTLFAKPITRILNELIKKILVSFYVGYRAASGNSDTK